MKNILIIISVISLLISLAAFADTYWEVYCNTEGRVISNQSSEKDAKYWGQRHVLDTGHTVTVNPKQRQN